MIENYNNQLDLFSSSVNSLVKKLKDSSEDFEFYPTTREIISCIDADLKDCYGRSEGYRGKTLLDVGAGNGNFFTVLESLNVNDDADEYNKFYITKYAIEKSQILINNMDSDIFVIGTDFYEQSFIDKNVDVVFNNPPYKDFAFWALKLIKECNCDYLYLVLPERWKENKTLLNAVACRSAKYEVIGNYSFSDSEYREARAVVDVVRVSYRTNSGYSYTSQRCSDPFKIWFEEEFKINAETSSYNLSSGIRSSAGLKSLVAGKDVIQKLEEYYKADLSRLLESYKAIEKLDRSLLDELKISVSSLRSAMQEKIKGLKNVYWKELFDNLYMITNRLTKKSRESILNTLNSHTSIDFTASNAYSVVIWAIKNSNQYIDSQLTDVYMNITNPENIENYKSNRHMIKDTWRYNVWNFRREAQNYKLDYRIVHQQYSAIETSYNYQTKTNESSLSDSAHSTINDVFTIARNLGFHVEGSSYEVSEWKSGKKHSFFLSNGDLFCEVKAYMKGTIHFRFNQSFIKKFNVEAGRLNGWIKTPAEAAAELNYSIEDVENFFNSNIKLGNVDVPLLDKATA